MLKKLFLGLLLSSALFQEMSALEFTIFLGKAAREKVTQLNNELDRQKKYAAALEARNTQLEQNYLRLMRDAELVTERSENLIQKLDSRLKAEEKLHKASSSKFKKALLAVPAAFLVGVVAGGAFVFKLAVRGVR